MKKEEIKIKRICLQSKHFFDEEITLGEFDIQEIIKADRKKLETDMKLKEEYAEGQPMFMSGEELIKFI